MKHVHSSAIGRQENCNMLIAHVQYVGAETMASQYAYTISLFDTGSRATGHKFQGLVTSTLRPLESQCTKDADIFVTTFHQARTYTDEWGNLNFIIGMKKLTDEPASTVNNKTNEVQGVSTTTTENHSENNNTTPTVTTAAADSSVPMDST